MRKLTTVCLVGIVGAAAACATTSFRSTWRNPATEPISLDGRRVVALVITTHESTRRTAEDTLAAQITARGARGVPAWTILPTDDLRNEEAARAAVASVGAGAVVTMEVVAQNREFTPSSFGVRWRSPNHRSFWPHYRWAWQAAWSTAPPARTTVWIETGVFTLEPDELIWAGRSRTTNASSTSALFAEVAGAAATEIVRAGLLESAAD
jgi:hypothetical protein